MVEPAFGVSENEAQEREALLQKASTSDHELAVQSVVELYNKFLDECTATQRKYYLSKLLRSLPHPDTISFCGNAWRVKMACSLALWIASLQRLFLSWHPLQGRRRVRNQLPWIPSLRGRPLRQQRKHPHHSYIRQRWRFFNRLTKAVDATSKVLL